LGAAGDADRELDAAAGANEIIFNSKINERAFAVRLIASEIASTA
jgi:hypothetical protein